jgi:Flp pilus assembly pilin Flp
VEIKTESGQTMVEYMLLLAVALSLVITFYNSDAFKKLFGERGELASMIKEESEFSYRHAYMRNRNGDLPRDSRDGAEHPSYYNSRDGESRFFGPKDTYPD